MVYGDLMWKHENIYLGGLQEQISCTFLVPHCGGWSNDYYVKNYQNNPVICWGGLSKSCVKNIKNTQNKMTYMTNYV